jgi:hypothetical protein
MTGEGGMWVGPGAAYTLERYVGRCLETGYGAPCFRDAALPIIVHFTDICSHNGPPGEEGSCSTYVGIDPPPHTWAEAISVMNLHGAKYIGVNASFASCAGVVGPMGSQPCWFMKRTAEETGSVDLDGTPLVYDLPNDGTSETLFIDTIANAIEIIATRVPLDVDTGLRNEPTNPDGVNATMFIKRRTPRCRSVPGEPCWTAPAGVSHDQAVALYDASTFFGVIPGTLVRFRITFQNDFQMGDVTARVYVAYIDVRGGGSAVLDTRQVYIVVPASSGPPII